MDMRSIGGNLSWRECGWILIVSVLACVCGAGCNKSAPSPASESGTATKSSDPGSTSTAGATIAKVHWLGKKRLSAETNATSLMNVWKLPASELLEAQTLDRLAYFPWMPATGLPTNSPPTNAYTAMLRPLLGDLVNQECYLEARQVTNQSGEFALAVRLNGDRAGFWQTNLATLLEAVTGNRTTASPSTHGWDIKLSAAFGPIGLGTLARAGEWTIVGFAQERNGVSADMLARISRTHVPFGTRPAEMLFTLELDLQRVLDGLGLKGLRIPEQTPVISLGMAGDGNRVTTRGNLTFSKNLEFSLEPWNIPTNLIHDPLVSFTAVRGIRPFVESQQFWRWLDAGPAPDQAFFWAIRGIEFQSFFSAPLPDASNRVFHAGNLLEKEGTAWLTTNGMGSIERPNGDNELRWIGAPFMAPFITSRQFGKNNYVYGGCFPGGLTNAPAPPELLHEVLSRSNLVYYDWEITGTRISNLFDIGQVTRIGLHRAQLPPKSLAAQWLKAVEPALDNCATVITLTEPNQIAFVRKSNVGFTGLELHVLADWLESPRFPIGLHTLLAPVRAIRTGPSAGPHGSTNAQPVVHQQ